MADGAALSTAGETFTVSRTPAGDVTLRVRHPVHGMDITMPPESARRLSHELANAAAAPPLRITRRGGDRG